MKISSKLVASFVGVSTLTSLVGIVAIIQSQKIAETLAIAAAENVAQVIATSITFNADADAKSIPFGSLDKLQKYVTLLHRVQQRDISVVNRQKLILADAVPQEVNTFTNNDRKHEIDQTIQDGKTRIFWQRGPNHTQGIQLVVIPLKKQDNQIYGAVILEWSSLYNESINRTTPITIILTITSLGCVVLALIIGWLISRSIAIPLQSVTETAQKVTLESNFKLRTSVTTKDEIGILAIAFNHLVQRVETLLAEKEQRSAELQAALTQSENSQIQLVQSEKMAILGQLVAGVAHEINNPVNFIHGNITHVDSYTQDMLKLLQAYQRHYPDPPSTLQTTLEEVELDFLCQDLPKLLQSMRVGTARIRHIVLSLRNFSRLDESDFKAADLHEGLDNTLLILQHRLKLQSESVAIEVVKNYGELPLVDCYPGQLNQVFMNLLVNAIDVLQESKPQKQIPGEKISPGTIWISTQVIPDNWVQITIKDNGSGMTETTRSRIFDPFFTTKLVSKGTGLGLSISYNIITEKHHGKIWCESAVGEGSKFVVQIPVNQPK